MDDWRLLRRYVEDGSQAAFTKLVTRHMKMVYWTCRRDLGDADLAEDAAQTVFVLFAGKAASLGPGVSIAGWLFNTARFVCRRTLRDEQYRRRCEQEVAKSMERTAGQDACWQQIEPWLNDGLSRLGIADREALLLRYFDDLSLAEVALATGTSEPAARKRVSRAVERLRRYLVNKEAAVTSTALAALLTEHLAKDTPLDCQATALHAVQKAAMHGHGASPLAPMLAKGILVMSTSKLIAGGVAAVALILVLAFVIVHHQHSASGSSDTQALAWQVPPASDPATQQAQQQIEADLSQFASGHASGNAQQAQAATSPSAPMYHHVPGVVHHLVPNGFHWTMASCIITGDKARVDGQAMLAFRGRPTVQGPATITLANTGGKWLITGIEDREVPISH